MLNLIAIAAYLSFGIATAALIWAIAQIEQGAEFRARWQPGTRPHTWRF